jgi:outer membrane protein assembly factor BamB
MQHKLALTLTCAVLTLPSTLLAGDWPQWAGSPSRNMVSDVKNLPDDFAPGKLKPGTDEIDMATTRGVRWIAKLGSQAYGNVSVAGGRCFIGTNNEAPRDPAITGDKGVVMAFDEKTGAFQWQLVIPKLGTGKVSDWEYLGICSSPSIENDKLYILTNRCEIVCLDVKGQSDGNQGPFTDEAQYSAGPGKPPVKVSAADGDILWRYDMREELGVFPHNITSSSPLLIGDRLYAVTSNGQDWSHVNIPNPLAPALICLDKNTGELLGEETLGISKRIMHSNWSSPTHGKVGDKEVIFFAAGDGFLYAFDPVPAKTDEGNVLKELFRVDLNPPEHKYDAQGKPRKYPIANGPSEAIATPVFHDGLLYIAVGQDPEHGDGVGCLTVIDVAKALAKGGDVTDSARAWRDTTISRSISTASIHEGLLYLADYRGEVRCYDAKTGKIHWAHDTKAHIWGSTLVADGKVYIGNEDGILTILKAGTTLQIVREIDFRTPIYSTPVAANGTLFVATMTHLYAIGK